MSLSSLYLDAFYACAKAGHVTRASESLNITQSACSQRVSKLEDELGITLFIRDSKGLVLTPEGHELLHYCQQKQEIEDQTLDRIVGGSQAKISGTIRIGGYSSVMRSIALPILSDLLTKHPHLRLQFITKELDELPTLLQRGEIDYMIHYNPIIKDQYEREHLGKEVNALVERKSGNSNDLFLDHDENDQTTSQYLEKYAKGKLNTPRLFLDDVYGLIDGVKEGIGRAVLPVHLIQKDKDIKILSPKKQIHFPVILHYQRKPYYSPLHEEIVSRLKSEVPKLLKVNL